MRAQNATANLGRVVARAGTSGRSGPTDSEPRALSVEARAQLIDRLQRGYTSAKDEAAIVQVFLETTGADLARLKHLVDRGPDARDLEHLVFADIHSRQRRRTLLDHFAAHAPRAADDKVLVDIDDTLLRSVNDPRYPRGTVYPGALQFLRELDGGADGSGSSGDVTFLTARPQGLFNLIEWASHRQLRGRTQLGDQPVLSSRWTHVFTRGLIAGRKALNVARYRQLYPEARAVFVGDNAQADVMAAQRVQREAPGLLRAAFIHRVHNQGDEARDGVIYFDNYVSAAVRAHGLGLMGAPGLRRVVEAARAEFERVPFGDAEQRAARRRELDAAVARAGEILGESYC